MSKALTQFWQEENNLPKVNTLSTAINYFRQALHGLGTAPVTTLITVFTITISLFLLGTFALVIGNFNTFFNTTKNNFAISVYLKDNTQKTEVNQLTSQIEQIDGIEKIDFLTKQDALNRFRTNLKDQVSLLEGLEQNNPLPASLEIKLKNDADATQVLNFLGNISQRLDYVEQVQYNKDVLTQFSSLAKILQMAGWVGILLVLVITGFIISSTIKLSLFSQRDEIEIMRLVGATNSFIRTPYLLEGVLQGLVGALLALVILRFFYAIIWDALARAEIISFIVNSINFLSFGSLFGIIILGAFVGCLASYFSLRKFLA